MRTDYELGKIIRQVLINNNVETPMYNDWRDPDARELELYFGCVLEELGVDTGDDSIIDTPKRVAKMYTEELFIGLDYKNFPKCTTVSNKFGYDEMVTVLNIPIKSMCEHHLLPIDGFAKISYIPKDKVLGLSKFNRVANFFARRPQVQERLTEQIYFALSYILNTNDIAIKITANHYCMKFRGVQSENSLTTTTKLGGSFRKAEVRAEFLNNK